MVAFLEGQVGVLPSQWLRKALEAEIVISDSEIPESNIQPASLDLRLGTEAFRLQCSFLPEGEAIEAKLRRLAMDRIDLTSGAVLEKDRPYLIPLMERLNLPASLWAKANPRSSTGRVDIFTRVLTDKSHTFDEIRPGYEGRMYLEVVPLSFAVRVQAGLSLNQLRLMAGRPKCTDEEILRIHQDHQLLFMRGQPLSPRAVTVSNGLFLSIDLHATKKHSVGYRAKKNSKLLDLTQDEAHPVEDFWEPVMSEKGNRLILEPGEFYLLLSAESVHIPPQYAAEMTAYDPTSGELRTHYAGFFDPGFGHNPGEERHGSRAALEVRAHDVPFMIEERQRVCRLAFEHMLEEPEIPYGQEIGSSYQHQTLTLSKYFLTKKRRAGRKHRQLPDELPLTTGSYTESGIE
jgi:dCTP deaminase